MRRHEAWALNESVIPRVASVYSAVRMFGETDSQLQERLNVIYAGMTAKRTPEWAKAYVMGYSKALRDQLYHDDLEFVYVTPNGGFFGTRPDTPYISADTLYGSDTVMCGVRWQDWKTAHAWRAHCPHAGRIFF